MKKCKMTSGGTCLKCFYTLVSLWFGEFCSLVVSPPQIIVINSSESSLNLLEVDLRDRRNLLATQSVSCVKNEIISSTDRRCLLSCHRTNSMYHAGWGKLRDALSLSFSRFIAFDTSSSFAIARVTGGFILSCETVCRCCAVCWEKRKIIAVY